MSTVLETSFNSITHRDMLSFNRVHIIGYQTQPVLVRQTPSGTSVTDLNIVVPYKFKSESGEMLEGKGFHTVTCWGPMADIAGKYVRAGSQLFISGRLQTDSWEDEKTSEKKSKTKIVALDLILLDPKEGQIAAPANAPLLTNVLNRADIVGNVTRDPELRTTTGGTQVLTLGVATNERWKDKASGELKDRAEFHNVVIWADLAAQVTAAVKKGSRVFVSGRVQTRTWETKEGSKRSTTEIVADTVLLLGVKNATAASSVQTDAIAPSQAAESEPTPVSVDAGIEAPEITYASEIKASDLPF